MCSPKLPPTRGAANDDSNARALWIFPHCPAVRVDPLGDENELVQRRTDDETASFALGESALIRTVNDSVRM